MKKINILLVCNAGMSTSLLIEKIEKAGVSQSIEAAVEARPVEDIKEYVSDKDVILLGPQVRFKRETDSGIGRRKDSCLCDRYVCLRNDEWRKSIAASTLVNSSIKMRM